MDHHDVMRVDFCHEAALELPWIFLARRWRIWASTPGTLLGENDPDLV
jgi:hypothetical protein